MVVDNLPVPFFEWLPQASALWLAIVLGLGLFCLIATYLVLAVRQGPLTAFAGLGRGLADTIVDVIRMSPRRVFALAWLAIKESIHRLVLATFGVFIVVLLFAGWYLDESSVNITELYLSFVMTATSYLVLLLALFLSVFSLPNDISKKTLHTIVTKPVRASEIVLGRILGFAATGTAMLAVTGLFSYLFVVRGLNHTHEIAAADLEAVAPQAGATNPIVYRGQSAASQKHRHTVYIYQNGEGRLETTRGHFHSIREEKNANGERVYRVGPPQLPARVPVYGMLTFKDRQGNPTGKQGINVGDEWTYRGYFEGATQASATWRFARLDPEQFKNGLRIELTLQVFRTHKGDIEQPIHGSITLRNPDTGLASEFIYFDAKEYSTDTHFVPRKLLDRGGNPIDLWQDLVSAGELEIEVSCLESGQFLGAGQGDLYLRATDASFAGNLLKGYMGIWLQMLVVICLGVTFSTFLNGAVAMLATAAAILGGFFTQDILRLARGETYGGGPLESAYRLVTQANVMTELDPGLTRDVTKMVDSLLQYVLTALGTLLPDFSQLASAKPVALGYDIPPDILLARVAMAAGYVIPVMLAGFLLFKSREVAR